MVQSSLVCALFVRLWTALCESKIIKLLSAVTNAFERGVKTSKTVGLFVKHNPPEQYADTSVFYRLISKIAGVFVKLFTGIYNGIRKINSGSICEKVYGKTFGGSYIFKMEIMLSLAVFVMMLVPHKLWNNMYALGIALILTLFYVLTLSSGKAMGQNAKAIWLPLLLFMFSVVLGVAVSAEKSDSIRVLVFFVTSFMLCFCVYGTLTDFGRINKFMLIVFAMLVVTSAFAVLQRIAGIEADASLTDLNLNENMPGRLFGTLGNPNNFAEYLVLIMPVGLAYALNIDDKKKKTGALLLMLLPLAALLGTYSRSSWISFAVSMVVFVVMWNRKSIPFWILLVVCLLPFLPESIWNRILTIGNLEDSSSAYRLNIWKGSFDMIKDYPISGIGLGPGAFTEIFPMYALENTRVAPHSHMQFLEVWVEMGIIGLLSFVWLSVALVRRCMKNWWSTPSTKIRTVMAAGAASMTAIAINGIFEYLWFYPRVMFIFFITVGFIMAAAKCSRETD